jgi:putative redox protein
MVRITGEYQGGLHCAAIHEPSGNVLSTDAPRDNQGRGEAFSPTDLVATAFGTCIATTMAIAARKHGVDIAGLKFEVTKEMAPDSPRRVSRLNARFWMPAAARKVPAGVLEKAASTCPVHQSLAPSVEKIIDFAWE